MAASVVLARAARAAAGPVAAARARPVAQRALVSRHARAGARHVIARRRVRRRALAHQLTAGTVRAVSTSCPHTDRNKHTANDLSCLRMSVIGPD